MTLYNQIITQIYKILMVSLHITMYKLWDNMIIIIICMVKFNIILTLVDNIMDNMLMVCNIIAIMGIVIVIAIRVVWLMEMVMLNRIRVI